MPSLAACHVEGKRESVEVQLKGAFLVHQLLFEHKAKMLDVL